jgi:hypothetical protein
VEEYLDSASLWHVLRTELSTDARQSFQKSMGRAGQSSVQMRFGDRAVRALLPHLATKETVDFAGPLAAAMPWNKMYEGRRTPDIRRKLYSKGWARFFQNPCMGLDQVARGIEQVIRTVARAEPDRIKKANLEDLATQEEYYPSKMPRTFVETIQSNCIADERNCRTLGTLENIQNFIAAVQALNTAILGGHGDYELMEQSYRKMAAFWQESPLHARALGTLFMDIATGDPRFPLDDVQASFVFQEGKSEEGPFGDSTVIGSKLA